MLPHVIDRVGSRRLSSARRTGYFTISLKFLVGIYVEQCFRSLMTEYAKEVRNKGGCLVLRASNLKE